MRNEFSAALRCMAHCRPALRHYNDGIRMMPVDNRKAIGVKYHLADVQMLEVNTLEVRIDERVPSGCHL
jgi:hypothetical protein